MEKLSSEAKKVRMVTELSADRTLESKTRMSLTYLRTNLAPDHQYRRLKTE